MLFKLRISVPDLDTGRSIAGLLNEAVVPEPLAVTLFESNPPAHIVAKCLEDDRFARAQPLRQPGAPAAH